MPSRTRSLRAGPHPALPRRAAFAGLPCALLLLAVLLPAPAFAASAGDRERAMRLAREGRCQAAVPELDRVRADNALDIDVEMLLGQCLIRLGRYEDAVAVLEDLRRVNAVYPGVDLELTIAYYHLGEREAARDAMRRAHERDPDRAGVQLYRGLILLEDARHAEAVTALERSRRLDAGYSDPVASYYQGLARIESEEREQAATALQRVVDGWPGTAWARQAQRALDNLDADPGQGWWIEAGAGLEYDSNVFLRGEDTDLPDGEDDGRGVFTLTAGTPLWQDEVWTVGVNTSFWGTKQFTRERFDTQYPTIGAWVDRELSDGIVLRGQYDFGYAWIDNDSFLRTHLFEGSLFNDWGEPGLTEIYVRYGRNDYFYNIDDLADTDPNTGLCGASECGPFGLNEKSARNQDGWEVATGFEHWVPLPWLAEWVQQPMLSGGYEFAHQDTRGREYNYDAHTFGVGFSALLPFEIALDTEASFTYRPFDDPSTYSNGSLCTFGEPCFLKGSNKRETEWRFAGELERQITDITAISVYYSYTDVDSTANVFEYDRHITGFQLKVLLGP